MSLAVENVVYRMRSLRGQARESRGFTLIELMIVVVIMGVLASLAAYSMLGYIKRSKTAEARDVIGEIMSAQEAYKGETGSYLDVTGGVAATNFYPADSTFNGTMKIQWGAIDSCAVGGTPCVTNFNSLGVYVNTPVVFRYASTTMAAGAAPPTGGHTTGFNPNNVLSTRPGYVVMALSDLEGSGDGKYTTLVGSSMAAAIHMENVGE